MFTVLPKIFALVPANGRFAEKNWLTGNTGGHGAIAPPLGRQDSRVSIK